MTEGSSATIFAVVWLLAPVTFLEGNCEQPKPWMEIHFKTVEESGTPE